MTRSFFGFFFLFLSVSSAESAPPLGKIPYYGRDFFESTLIDAALKEKLFQILTFSHTRIANDFDRISPRCQSSNCVKHTEVGYVRAREFIMGDFYLIKSGSTYGIKDVYCQRVVESEEFSETKPAPNIVPDPSVVNTEHTWPQSKFVKGLPKETQKSDMHHLFPTDAQTNADRSSFEFGDVQSDSKHLKCAASRLGLPVGGTKPVFEAPLSHKGNVARAIFYFSTRYGAPIDSAEEETLREWNRLDPVDAEEKTRNELIYQKQFNRNPFIDYPELVDRIRDF